MKIKKPSKRVTLGTKYKREAKGREKMRKLRKEAKKAKQNGTYQKKIKKDPGIPNLWPFKHDMLVNLQRKKNAVDTARLEGKLKKPGSQQKNTDTIVPDYATMVRENQKRTRAFQNIEQVAEVSAAVTDNTRKAFYRDLRKVIEQSDILIEVLDARDPNSCRCPELEQEILERGKKVVLVMNKIDLVPQDATVAWLEHLRREFPTVAFKAARTSKSGGAERPVHTSAKAEQASAGLLSSAAAVVGADRLMSLLKNYSRISADKKRAITVGVVGYPNVGKSSVINSLKRSAAVKVGATAGMTRTVQEVQLDSKLTLIDSPGVVFAGDQSDPSVVLRNAANVETLADPCGVVDALLQRAPRAALLRHFCVADFSDVQGFLVQIARLRGKLKKGGAANLEAAARLVLTEWTNGKLRYYCLPPKVHGVKEQNAELAASAKVVPAYSKELDIDALFRDEAAELSTLGGDGKAMPLAPGEFGAAPGDPDDEMEDDEEEEDDDEDDEDDEMDEDEDEDEEEDDDEVGEVMIDEAPRGKKKGDAYDFATDFHLPG